MKTLHRFSKPVSGAVVTGLLALSLHLPAANAALVGTDAAIETAPAQQGPDRAQDAIHREAVKAKLLSLGVDPAQVQARVDALTGSEAQTLAMQLDRLPAGGADPATILVVLLLLLIIF